MKVGDLVKMKTNSNKGIIISIESCDGEISKGVYLHGDVLVLWEDGIVRPGVTTMLEVINESR
tara:strand:- start:515 stop:703 length:189 start_codon:yes stop_codon:yes gene_type:complete